MAGFSGILPVTPGLGELSKPRAHAIKLRVSDSQQSSAAMLDELLENESKGSYFISAKKTSSVPILRWIISILLFLLVGSSIFSKTQMVSLPKMEVPEIRDTINAIDKMPSGGSTLVIFDYEAGFSGEMKPVAAPLVRQLMARGEMVVVISTSPMGPSVAENFLAETQSHHQFETGNNYINLGYLPGGFTGILSFINNPRETIATKVNEDSVWNLPPLSNIANFSDFSAVILLTDDVEKGRNWIEQKTAYYNDPENTAPPFLMAISAQAEPIIYPYYASGQIDGLVSGLAGGATYERMQKQKGVTYEYMQEESDFLGRKYWDSYSVGLLLAEISIAIGAMVNFLISLKSGQKSKEEN